MAHGKMRVGFAIVTAKGAFWDNGSGRLPIYKRKAEALATKSEWKLPDGYTVVRVTIDTDD